MSARSIVGVLLSVAAASTVIAGQGAAQSLPTYNIDQNQIFVAGFSSGGYMAVQMHVAFSSLFKGAAVYAGGPYYCAQDNLTTAETTCLVDEPALNLAPLESTTTSWASKGLIDPVANLQGQPVYLWSGTADSVVEQPLMDALKSYYENFQASVFRYDNNFDAQHGWESPYGPLSCDDLASPFLISCSGIGGGGGGTSGLFPSGLSIPGLSSGSLPGLSVPGLSSGGTTSLTGVSIPGLSSGGTTSLTGVSIPGLSSGGTTSLTGVSIPGLSSGDTTSVPGVSSVSIPGLAYDSEQVWLTQWFGDLNAKNQGTLKGGVIPFDQNEFAPGGSASAISMDTTGYAFVPAQCASGQKCGLILVLHACLQNYATVGWAFIDDAGINEWADTNGIVVLYPQTVASDGINPEGCWDWWGYLNDPNYAQKGGPQMQALSAMVKVAAGLGEP
jgi:poly(3-hydroxybutyrate) depolymerase